MKLPAYGKELLDARRRGLRPAPPFDVVWITDSWDLAKRVKDWDFFALVCNPPAAPYDFLLLYDLPVVVMTDSDDVLGLVERIARAQPRSLQVPRRALRLLYWLRVTGQAPPEELAALAEQPLVAACYGAAPRTPRVGA